MSEIIEPTIDDFDNKRIYAPKLIAQQKFKEHKNKALVMYKTTRAGATTAILSVSLDQYDRFVCVQPNNRIAAETVAMEAIKYSDRKDAVIHHIPSNAKCLMNVLRCEKHPELKHLKLLPISFDCGPGKCDLYDECPLVAPMREKWDGITLTYHKLCAIMLAPRHEGSLAASLYEELRGADNFILDEIHMMEYLSSNPIPLHRTDDPMLYDFDPRVYNALDAKYTAIIKVIDDYTLFRRSRETAVAIAEMEKEAFKEGSHSRYISKKITNPHYVNSDAEHAVQFFNGLVNLMIDRKKYKLSIKHVVALHDMYFIAAAKEVAIFARYIPHKQCVITKARAANNMLAMMVRDFFDDVQEDIKFNRMERRIFITSATIGDIDVSKYVSQYTPVVHEMFGHEGDPKRTNDQLTIICDDRTYSAWGKNATHKYFGNDAKMNRTNSGKRLNVAAFIKSAIMQHGEDITIVALSKADARRLENAVKRELSKDPEVCAKLTRPIEVDYYRSDRMAGVKSESRVMIVIGIAYQPSNTYDAYTMTLADSRRMLAESVQAATYQAIGRVKASSGTEPSLVYALFCTEEEMRAVCTWGIGRKLGTEKGEGRGKWGMPFLPTCERSVSMPRILVRERHHMLATGLTYVNSATPKHTEIQYKPQLLDDIFRDDEGDTLPTDESVEADAGEVTEDEAINRRLNTFEQNYPIDDSDEVLGLPIDDDYPDLRKDYTVESWTAWEDHLNEQFKTIRVSPGWYCNDTLTFLHHVFATRPDLIYIQQITNGKQSYYAKKRSPYITMEAQMTWIDRHTAGTITIGSPCIDENGNVKWGCYDIDAHQKKNDTGTVLIKKRYWAELKTMKLLAYLHKKGIPYILERSGSTASYHIWISVVPVDAKLAMWYFRAMALAAGVTDLEINPKQGRAGAKGSGNQVKLPFGKHQANKSRSKLWINGEWVGPRVSNRGYSLPGEFVDIMHRAIDIRDVDMNCPKLVRIADIPEVYLVEDGREYSAMESTEYTGGSGEYAGIRRFFLWLLTQDLSGEQGHWARIYLAREFLNAGWAYEKIAALFEHQGDYDFDESLKAVKYIAGKDYGNVQYESIWLRCQSFAEKYEQETGYSL